MNSAQKYFLVSGEGQDVKRVEKAFLQTSQLSQELKANEVVLFVPDRKVRGTALEKFLSSKVYELLLQGKPQRIAGRFNLRLADPSSYNRTSFGEIIIGFHPTKEMLDLIDGLEKTAAVIIIPASRAEAEEWIKNWNPQVIAS